MAAGFRPFPSFFLTSDTSPAANGATARPGLGAAAAAAAAEGDRASRVAAGGAVAMASLVEPSTLERRWQQQQRRKQSTAGEQGAEEGRMGVGRQGRPRAERSAAVDCSCGVFLLRPHILRLAGGPGQRRRRRLRPSAALALESDAAVGALRVELAMAVGVEVIPHPKKVEKGGEDAHFVSDCGGGVIGVADGVSGWAEENVDPALFSREFVAHASKLLQSGQDVRDPRALLRKAHQATKSIGAATVCVAALEKKGTLHIANLGDCGLRVVRGGRVVFGTAPQQHYFDCPYQFSSAPGAQSAADAAVYHLPVKQGDTIVLGSDGLFDNVYDRDIEYFVNRSSGTNKDSAQTTAIALASLAYRHSRDEKYESPYTREAVAQGIDVPFWKKILGQKLTGGKLDDITVVVAHVVDARTLARPASPPAVEDSMELSQPFSGSDAGTVEDSLDTSSSGSVSCDSRTISISVDSPLGVESVSIDWRTIRRQPSR